MSELVNPGHLAPYSSVLQDFLKLWIFAGRLIEGSSLLTQVLHTNQFSWKKKGRFFWGTCQAHKGKAEIQVRKCKTKCIPSRNLQGPKDCTVCPVNVLCNNSKSINSAILACLLPELVSGRWACVAFLYRKIL